LATKIEAEIRREDARRSSKSTIIDGIDIDAPLPLVLGLGLPS
jgi:hypothetical protein